MAKVHVATPEGQITVYEESRAIELHAVGELPPGSLYWTSPMPRWRPVEELVANESAGPPPLPRKPFAPLAVAAVVLAGAALGALLIGCVITFLRGPLNLPFLALGLVAAITALICAAFASRGIEKSCGERGGEDFVTISRVLAGFVFVGLLLSPALARPHHHGGPRTIDANNIRQIAQASLIYANDNREQLPPAIFSENGAKRSSTVHDVAKLLAKRGGINDGSLWFSREDEALSEKAREWQGIVFDRDRNELNPEFVEQHVFSFDYVTGVNTSLSLKTPIAWTRGLRPDGTWDPAGVYGTDGGHIVFIGGNVSFYRDLKGGENSPPPLVGTDGQPTSNILDTLPPGARVVGGGPGSLNGYFKPATAVTAEREAAEARSALARIYVPSLPPRKSTREIGISKFRAIGRASLTYARQNDGNFPGAVVSDEGTERLTSVHDVAVSLARHGDLADGRVWFFDTDLTLPEIPETLTVLEPATGEIDPRFEAQGILSVDYATNLTTDAPPTTPLAWTRGLQENGKWRDGGDGGYILFVNGTVSYFDTLGSKRVHLIGRNGESTSNILDTLPPGTRIMGSGPGSLGGTEIPANVTPSEGR